MLFLMYCVATWSLAPWPFNFWLFVIGAATDDRCREPFREAFKRHPEIVGEVARCDVEGREARRRRMIQNSYASSAPRGH
jgi:hypothetical protein